MARVAVVTGGHGFIGRHACRALAKRGFVVHAIGHGQWNEQDLTHWGVASWTSADISFESLDAIGCTSVDAVLHCAGTGSVSHSFSSPLDDHQRSVTTVATLLEWVRTRSQRTRVALTSSAAVYGDQGDVDLVEASPCSPMSPYGFSKCMAEDLCRSYSRFFGLHISIVRLFSVYGEGLKKQLLWDAANKLSSGDPRFFGTGHELRDWIHVDDAADLMCEAATGPTSHLEVLNGGSEKATTSHVLSELARLLGCSIAPAFTGKTHTGNPRRLTADSSHVSGKLGWKPRVTLDQGLHRYADWFLSAGALQ
jgi:UDP-glucose 4-epimerase